MRRSKIVLLAFTSLVAFSWLISAAPAMADSVTIAQVAANASAKVVQSRGTTPNSVVITQDGSGLGLVAKAFESGSGNNLLIEQSQGSFNSSADVRQFTSSEAKITQRAAGNSTVVLDQTGVNTAFVAQENTASSRITIAQFFGENENANTASVVQKNDDGSRATINQSGRDEFAGIEQTDGVGNIADIFQGNDGGSSNNAQISQTGSLNEVYVRQWIDNNRAAVEQSGFSNKIEVYQGEPFASEASNSATLRQSGSFNGLYISQSGATNTAVFEQAGTENILGVAQDGNNNTAIINQLGERGSITLAQSGNNGTATITQNGVGNTILANQNGNNAQLTITQN